MYTRDSENNAARVLLCKSVPGNAICFKGVAALRFGGDDQPATRCVSLCV